MEKRLQAAFEQHCRDKLHQGEMTEDEYIAILRHPDVWLKCRSTCADICEEIAKQVEQNQDGNVYYNRSNAAFAREIGKVLRPEDSE